MIQLANSRIRMDISESDGSICSLKDKLKSKAYIVAGEACEPFRLETASGVSSAFERFDFEVHQAADRQEVHLTWLVRNGLQIKAFISLRHDADELEFRCEAVNDTDEAVISLEYPVLGNLGAITAGGESDFAAHSFATGFKIQNPLKHFEQGGAGLRFMPYPESFSGASMQFFTYYGQDEGGLYFAALDGEGCAKWLNFYKNSAGLLEASFIHGCEDMGAGKGIRTEYPIVVKLLEGRDWYEAADHYKAWAEQQSWCAKGKLVERKEEERCDWLYEQMGAATFGINAGFDRTEWLDQYHEHIRTPMFHILGPDWTNAPQTFYKGVPGGLEDWFPTSFNPQNLEAMKRYGDKYAPFEFDYLFNFEGDDGVRAKAAAQKFPEKDRLKSIDAYRFPFICPAAEYTQQFHVERDETLQRNVDVDSIYYDISANNIMKICLDDSHGHPVGAGKAVQEAYRQNYIRTKAAMIKAAGRYVPMGTEMMNEMFLDVLDYYQARAGGQPAAPLEGYPLRDLIKAGQAELIPMFAYVYHEYGAVRLDGWGKLTEEIGSLYYFTVARTYLWGGLYELNYEYSPMEALKGKENAPEEHYYPFEPRGYAFSAERADYLAQFADLRTGAGNKYLAYGKMLPPLAFERGRISAEWFHYNHGKETKEYNDSGVLEVDAVVHSAWRFKEESTGLFFANVSNDNRLVRAAASELERYDARPSSEYVLHTAESGGEEVAISPGQDGFFELVIPPRSVVLLELR
ncbi:hypothetical protein BK133_25240 [Paenibacillus sp. FSL H8-0548]|uniref:DUF6259 domain-containing protein n=1 Tax=Paenibacillus sp. FSL H8-0548 TaxID=1920422 RepID=UPI00096E1151|nr:DUF6259 domain-containing protein [Paenibacillus sp. FSL H8-0548]OMF22895.1 hypothetical protein BK133_25240 [Paenibacillus sp. FSL H8-0548]